MESMKINSLKERLNTEKLKEYQPIPFWSWNAKLEPEELRKQICWMYNSGLGGFFMHARSGLKTEYLSEEWMECIEVCAEEAEKFGMDAWAYDENGWPSGFAGGKLLEDPQKCDKYILSSIGNYDKEATVSYLILENELVRVDGEEKEKEYLNLYIHTAISTADILNPEVVREFLDLTHEKYKERFGDNFSKKIKGFFTDEPQYHRWNTPYTDMVKRYFEDEYNEDVLDGLGLLFVEKEGYREFRYKYYKALQTLMLNAFAKMTYEWCEKNGVKLTGHYIEETTLGFQMLCCGGIMPFYEYEHIPGIDWLGKETINELAPRQVYSVACQLGKKQILTETYAGCGWDISLSDLRRIAGFQYVNGVNLLCHHLIPYAEYGNRKHDFPAHYSPINPWIRDSFKDFNDYFTRLGYLLANSTENVNVAVLHPIRSSYFYYKRNEFNDWEYADETNDQLMQTIRKLSCHGIGYHFLDETLLEKYGFVEGKKMGCRKCKYDYLVIPSIDTMDASTEKLIREYVDHGGKIWLTGKKPTYLETKKFDYIYLESNCDFKEIIDSQSIYAHYDDTQIYSTYREIDGTKFLFVQNASTTEEQVQRYTFKDNTRSFLKLDLNTFHTESMPLEITLKPGESAFLLVDEKEHELENKLQTYDMKFENAKVEFEENLLVIDQVSKSLDGINYSKPIPCAAMFQQLLEERYEGELFLKYQFLVKNKPSEILIRAEECNAIETKLNDCILMNKMESGIEKNVIAYDVKEYVREGVNEYTVKVNWTESESVYYALFGENVTESLKNCIVYDSELEPIYVAGKFGVFPKDGYKTTNEAEYVRATEFYIGEVPNYVTEPVMEGFPFLAGNITLTQKIKIENTNILLKIDGTYQTAKVSVNGNVVGKLLFDKELDISHYAQAGDNEISVEFCIGNRNLLGPQHHTDNKGWITPEHFELNGMWVDGKSERYHDDYELKYVFKGREQ